MDLSTQDLDFVAEEILHFFMPDHNQWSGGEEKSLIPGWI